MRMAPIPVTAAGLTLTGAGWLTKGRYLLAELPSLNPATGIISEPNCALNFKVRIKP